MKDTSSIETVVRTIGTIPDARVSVEEQADDVVVRFADGPERRLHLVLLGSLSQSALLRLLEQPHDQPRSAPVARLLVVRRLRAPYRLRLAEQRYSWVETDDGFLHLDVPPYFVHVEPARRRLTDSTEAATKAAPKARPGDRPVRLQGRTAQCAEALCLWAAALSSNTASLPALTPNTLAAAAGVTATLAGRVLHRLEEDGVLAPERKERRTICWHLRDLQRLVDLWTAEDRAQRRVTKAYVYARHSGELYEKLARLSRVTPDWALGGTAAANVYAPTLTADPTPTVYLPRLLDTAEAAAALGGEIVDSGANLVFWQVPRDPWRAFAGRSLQHNASETTMAVLRHAAHWPLPWHERGLSLISAPRALMEALQDESGRSEEVAKALETRLSWLSAPRREGTA